MAKFLKLIEDFDPNNATKMDGVFDFKEFLNSKGIHLGKRPDGTLYIDNPESGDVYVVELIDVSRNEAHGEEDGEEDDVIDTASSFDKNAAAAKTARIAAVKTKLPKVLTNYKNRTQNILKMQ